MAEAARQIRLLECSICLQVFTDPRLLACGHTFCLKCLENASSKQESLLCSLCRKPTQLAEGGVAGLAKNYIVQDIANANRSPTDNVIKCVLAEEDDDECHQTAEFFCGECHDYLCNECFRSHKRNKQTVRHTPTKLTEMKPGEVEKHVRHRPPTCSKHKNQDIDLYCKICERGICLRCKVLEHDSHICLDIHDADSMFSEAIINVEKKAKEQYDLCSTTVDKLGKSLKTFEGATSSTRSEVKTSIDKMQKQINDTNSRIMHELQVNMDKTADKVDNFIGEINHVKEPLKQILNGCKALLEEQSPYGRFSQWKFMQKALEDSLATKNFSGVVNKAEEYAEKMKNYRDVAFGISVRNNSKTFKTYDCTFARKVPVTENGKRVVALCIAGDAFCYAQEGCDLLHLCCDVEGKPTSTVTLNSVSSVIALHDKRIAVTSGKNTFTLLSTQGEKLLEQSGVESGLHSPWSISISPQGTLYVADSEDGVLVCASTNMQWEILELFPELKDAWRIVPVGDKNLWVGCDNQIFIYEVRDEGNGNFGLLKRVISPSDIANEVDFFSFISDDQGNVLIIGQESIHMLNTSGDYLATIIKGLNKPLRLALHESKKELYVSHGDGEISVFAIKLIEMTSHTLEMISQKHLS